MHLIGVIGHSWGCMAWVKVNQDVLNIGSEELKGDKCHWLATHWDWYSIRFDWITDLQGCLVAEACLTGCGARSWRPLPSHGLLHPPCNWGKIMLRRRFFKTFGLVDSYANGHKTYIKLKVQRHSVALHFFTDHHRHREWIQTSSEKEAVASTRLYLN